MRECLHTAARCRDRLKDLRRAPDTLPQRYGGVQLLRRLARLRPVRLVDNQNVGDLKQARLHRLDAITKPRRNNHDTDVSHGRNIDLVLTCTDRLKQNEIITGHIKGIDHPDRRRGKAAEVTLTGKRTYENAVIVKTRGHADTVAENCPTRYRARWVNRDHAEPQVARAPTVE